MQEKLVGKLDLEEAALSLYWADELQRVSTLAGLATLSAFADPTMTALAEEAGGVIGLLKLVFSFLEICTGAL